MEEEQGRGFLQVAGSAAAFAPMYEQQAAGGDSVTHKNGASFFLKGLAREGCMLCVCGREVR